ncbi:MAG TPA: hypothetical protein VHZ32_19030 [Rhizomicrobium sp.]|nr:hypothetical protein [Rhizomicrobium sp.]
MIWQNGRFGWPLVLAVLFSTAAILGLDFAWRMVQAPVSVIAVAGAAMLVAGNTAILLIGARAR